MLKLHRIRLVSAILGGVAALSVGAGVSQAYGPGDGGPGNCTENKGSIRCEQTSTYKYTSDDGSVTVTSKTQQNCRNEQGGRRPAEQRPVSTGNGDVSSVGSSCVQKGPEIKMP